MQKLGRLIQQLGYQFKNALLLEAALSHRSVGNQNNERLEFLGDAILNFIIAAELFKLYPKAREGELSRMRARLVNGEMLAILANEFQLGDFLRLGAGELKSGGYRRQSILADAMEAIIGAIYLDADLQTCQERILNWFGSRLAAVTSLDSLKDPKTQLQEYLQAQKLPLPEYKIIAITGEAHAQTFYITCTVAGIPHISEGVGPSRRKAEQEAAQKMFEILNHD